MDKIKELKRLRKKGYSINELVVKLSIPKTTVWHHIHNVKISPKYTQIIRAKQGGSAKRKQVNIQKAQKYAEQLLQGPDRELCIILAMLHWTEGHKKSCEFINSDGNMVKVYLIILKKVFKLIADSIKPTLRIFSGMDKEECLNYWSRITKIPRHRFFFRLNDGGTRGRTRYGMCRITVKKGSNLLKIFLALIEQIHTELIASHGRYLCSRSSMD